MSAPPPPPPPHGHSTGSERSGLPPGNYDIFIIPPHSSGSGFLYLPSLQPHRNSFLAGVACTLLVVAIWTIVFPVLREWFSTIVASGGMGVVILLMGVGVAGWAWGKTQLETGGTAEGGAGGSSNTYANGNAAGGSSSHHAGGVPDPQPDSMPGAGPRAPPKPTWQRSNPGPANANASAGPGTGTANGAWEKAREETRQREEIRKRMDELRKKREDEEKERVKQREKDAREREMRERRERLEKERAAKEKEKEKEKEKDGTAAAAKSNGTDAPLPTTPRKPTTSRPASPTKRHQPPTANTADDASSYSYRPYDKPAHKTSASSIYSGTSTAPSHSTAHSTPPPSHCGPYHTEDPDKIVLKAVYSFNNTFTKLPVAQLISGSGNVTDGLILRITTEGLFIDDDVRGVPQREWDVKAWTMRLVESGEYKGLHVLRASIRDQEGKRYVFILQEEEGWKVAVGLQRLRRGTQVRALGVSGMAANETKAILLSMGWAS